MKGNVCWSTGESKNDPKVGSAKDKGNKQSKMTHLAKLLIRGGIVKTVCVFY